jgi:hypothetical protein
MLPINPIAADHTIVTRRCSSRFGVGQKGNPKAQTIPIRAPPAAEAARPVGLTPPFVPGGTVANVVINLGGLFDRIPSSEAHVSAVAAA